jgi:hypothetical protein
MVGGLEAVHLAGEGDRQVVDRETGDRSDTVAAAEHAGPKLLHADADRRDRPDPRDDGSAFLTHGLALPRGGWRAGI